MLPQVMEILRENRDSLVATLEAFVHDPLISWRLLNTKKCVALFLHDVSQYSALTRLFSATSTNTAADPRWPPRLPRPQT